MRFQLHEDIDAGIDDVYKVITDYETIERGALRRGIEARRSNPDAPVDSGSEWHVKFAFRGKSREASVVLETIDAPNSVSFSSDTDGLQVPMTIELVALSRTATRMSMDFELKATNLASKLLIQSLRLARGSIDKKLKSRLASMAKDIEKRVLAVAKES